MAIAGASLALAASASAASFTPGPGRYEIDTEALQIKNPEGNVVATGVEVGGVAVFTFESVSIPAATVISAFGTRPLELLAEGEMSLAGRIHANGIDAVEGHKNEGSPGPGGGVGGSEGGKPGEGPGGGGAGTTGSDGGGGGGFGGVGAAGGSDSGIGGAGGASYGNLATSLQGGSGGGGASEGSEAVGGGGGGGAVELRAASLVIASTGAVIVSGGNGSGGSNGASGGGSGGGILLHASTINVSGALLANGGNGGTGGCCGDGGGGGGGRIALQYQTLVNEGHVSVAGGESGATGTYGFGDLSPLPLAGEGVVTKEGAPIAATAAATTVSNTGATLNGTVDPNGNPTTYQFEYGTTTAYGKTIPAAATVVGSDTLTHQFSASVAGLAPGTTYHYRIVARNQLGEASAGSDATFTTSSPSAPTPAFSGVSITGGTIIVKNGAAYLSVSSTLAATGKLTLSDVVNSRTGKVITASAGHSERVTLGSASFSIAAGGRSSVKIPLSGRALKLLKKDKTMKATATAVATDSFGTAATTKAVITLKKSAHRKH